MASVLTRLPCLPMMVVNGRHPYLGTLKKLAMPIVRERQNRFEVATKATDKSSETSIIKSVQNVWDKPEDRLGLIGLGFAGVVALWATISLVTVIEKFPLVPTILELVGILFSLWFINRYLLYKPTRQELSQVIGKAISDILGQ
ncbi:protein CURVATURE THYLAKOID 1C, chloroplastic [Andrographis paniculata]|uniref:protein CURVATURE THYLAKOID 1C, chloroplastic n=1 Tax=Andrographis paniculata TaxID=175694 RepID=UPI0021E78A0A|nr:protein CURVATURE THYLAKOID 1C, chloroplastic [Andrographis paniculata]XP_051115318.1 protein CURVATURE THYLAKOID 1C, chloroplastic [Andrographis paniculata]